MRNVVAAVARMLLTLLLSVVALAGGIGDQAQAQLVISLPIAQGSGATPGAPTIGTEDRSVTEARRALALLAPTSSHAPGALDIHVGSWWVTFTLYYPDGVATRVEHTGFYPARDRANASLTWLRFDPRATLLGGNGLGQPGELRDPYREPIRRWAGGENGLMPPTLLTVRIPLSAAAVISVLREKASIGSGVRCYDLFAGRGQATGEDLSGCESALTVAARLVRAAAGASVVVPDARAGLTPLAWAYSLGLRNSESFRSASGSAACKEPATAAGSAASPPGGNQAPPVEDWLRADVRGLQPDVQTGSAALMFGPSGLQRLAQQPEEIRELGLNGIWDQTYLIVLDCIMRRELTGSVNYALPSVAVRSQYYRLASLALTEKFSSANAQAPLFFEAAHIVTQSLGVGAIDIIDTPRELPLLTRGRIVHETPSSAVETALSGDDAEGLRRGVGLLGEWAGFVYPSERSTVGAPPPLPLGAPNAQARALLRRINLALFDANRDVLRRVTRSPASSLFDPMGAVGDVSPLRFDLRMVLLEQGIVEEQLAALGVVVGDDVDRQLTGAATLLFRIVPTPAAPSNLWVTRTAGRLVASLDERASQISRDSFRSYWHRVAIGSAYVMALHYEKGRMPQLSEACPGVDVTGSPGQVSPIRSEDEVRHAVRALTPCFRRYIEGLLRSAPRAGMPSDVEQLREVLTREAAPDLVETRNRLVAALQLLQPAPSSVPAPGFRPAAWYSCQEPASPRRPAVVTQNPPGPLVGWTEILQRLQRPEFRDVLAAAREVATVGGALAAPPMLETGSGLVADADLICRAIQSRYRQVAALLAPDGSSARTMWTVSSATNPLDAPITVLQRSRTGEPSRLFYVDDEDAIALRTELPLVWPHLVHSIRALGSPGSSGSPRDIADVAVRSWAEWEVGARRARVLASASAQARGHLGLPEAPPGYRSYEALADEALGPAVVTTLPEGATEAQRTDWARQFTNRRDPLELLRQLPRQQRAFREIEERLNRERGRGGPALPYPLPSVRSASSVSLGRVGSGSGPNQSRFGFNLRRTGQVSEGRPLNRADFVFRLATPVASVSAEVCPSPGSTATGATLNCAEPALFGQRMADGDQIGMRVIPMGLEIADVVALPGGALRSITPGGLQNMAVNAAATREALASLGIPALFKDASVAFEVSSDLQTVTLLAQPRVLGVVLPEIRLPLLTGGTDANVGSAFRREIIRASGSVSGQQLLPLVRPFGFEHDVPGVGRLVLSPSASSVCLRVMWGADQISCDASLPNSPRDSQASAPTEPDPATASVAVSAQFNLSFLPAGRGLSAALEARAKATLVLDDVGLHLTRLDFEESRDGLERIARAFLQALAANLGIDAQMHALNVRAQWRTVTSSTRNQSHSIADAILFLVSGSMPVPGATGCSVPFTFDIPLAVLAEPSGRQALMRRFSDQATAGATVGLRSCARTLGQETLQQLADQLMREQAVTLFGTTWRLARNPTLQGDALQLAVSVSRTPPGAEPALIEPVLLRAQDGSLNVDLGGLSPAMNGALADALLSRALEVFRSAFGELVTVSRPAIGTINGRWFAHVDVGLRDVPFLGEMSLGRIDLAGTDAASLEARIRDAFAAQAQNIIARQLPPEINMPHIGLLRLTRDGVRVSGQGRLSLPGVLDIRGFVTVPVELEIDLGKGSFSFRRTGGNPLEQINNLVRRVVPFGGDNFRLEDPRFAELQPGSRRYGLIFGAMIDFGFMRMRVERIVVSVEGLRLDGAISARLPVDIELGYVSLTGITATYQTGTAGGRAGLMLNADIAPGTAALANIAKIDADLDLREIGKLRFQIEGDVVVFNSLPILLARGDVDLGGAQARFQARSAPALSSVLSARGEAWVNGRAPQATGGSAPTLGADTDLSVLGIRLTQQSIRAVIADPGEIRYTAHAGTPIGGGSLNFQSRLNLGDPRIRGDIRLDLFGWSPAGAGIEASTRSARASFRFLAIQLGVTARSADLFDPGVVLRMIMDLFKVRLEDILKMDLRKIELQVSRLGKGGEITESRADGSSGDGARSARASPGSADRAATLPADRSGRDAPAVEQPRQQQARSERTEQTLSMNDGFGVPGVMHCENVFDSRYEFWFRRTAENRIPLLPSLHPHRHPQPLWVSQVHPFTARIDGITPPLCSRVPLPGGGVAFLRDANSWVPVGARRTASYRRGAACDVSANDPRISISQRRNIDPSREQGHSPSRRPMFCWQDQRGRSHEAWGELYTRGNGRDFLILMFCPSAGQVPSEISSHPLFQRVCLGGSRGFHQLSSVPRDLRLTGERLNLVSASDEFRLMLAAQAELRGRAVPVGSTAIPIAQGVSAVVLPELEGDAVQRLTVAFYADANETFASAQVSDPTLREMLARRGRYADGRLDWLSEALLRQWWIAAVEERRDLDLTLTEPRIVYLPIDAQGGGDNRAIAVSFGAGAFAANSLQIDKLHWFWRSQNGPMRSLRVIPDTGFSWRPTLDRLSGGSWLRLLSTMSLDVPALEAGAEGVSISVSRGEREPLEFLAYYWRTASTTEERVRLSHVPVERGVLSAQAAERPLQEDELRERLRRTQCGSTIQMEEAILKAHRASAPSGAPPATVELRRVLAQLDTARTDLRLNQDPVDALLVDFSSRSEAYRCN